MFKILILVSTFTFSFMANASCNWEGFSLPRSWEISLQNQVQNKGTDYQVSEGHITFNSHDEIINFISDTVNEGLSRIASVNPCLLNEKIAAFGNKPVVFTSRYSRDNVNAAYSPGSNGHIFGVGSRKAQIHVSMGYPTGEIAKIKNRIIHGVLHHLKIDNVYSGDHTQYEDFEKDNSVFQDFAGFDRILQRDRVYACTQVAYPNPMFVELQGAEFMSACLTCAGASATRACEDYRDEFLNINQFHPLQENFDLLNISERVEFRRRVEDRSEEIRKRLMD